jgi:uncharacterized protein with HEPN domain
MAEPTERDAALLLDMLLAGNDTLGFIVGLDKEAFLASRLHQNTVIRSLEVIGEAAGKVSPVTRAAHPQIPWRDVMAMRNRLIHGHGDIRLDLAWVVACDRLRPLIAELERLVPSVTDEG